MDIYTLLNELGCDVGDLVDHRDLTEAQRVLLLGARDLIWRAARRPEASEAEAA
jgi:hypothetical protein